MQENPYFTLTDNPSLKHHIRKEREKARQLRKTAWWRNQVRDGQCHYCEQTFSPSHLTMDHIVPLARGGKSSKGNIVPSCLSCNKKKNLETPAESLLRALASATHPPLDSPEKV